MFLESYYNDVVNFTEWINSKFYEWRGDSRLGITDFAAYIGVSQQSMSKWINGHSKRAPDAKSIAKLAEKYPDVYEILGLPTPNQSLPPEMRRRLERAQVEVERVFRRKGITGEDPEAERVAIEIFEKHGFKYISTKTEPD